ncbi:hypothetical protein GQ457_07G003020 [Hibiscus cannabinus]
MSKAQLQLMASKFDHSTLSKYGEKVNRSTTSRVQNKSGSKTGRVQNRSSKIGSQVGFGCYSNRSDSVPGQLQSVTDRIRVIPASGQTRI